MLTRMAVVGQRFACAGGVASEFVGWANSGVERGCSADWPKSFVRYLPANKRLLSYLRFTFQLIALMTTLG